MYARAVERSDAAALAASYSEDCEVVSPIFGILNGRPKLEASFRDLFRGFSDITVKIDDVIVDESRQDRAVILFTTSGVHKGRSSAFLDRAAVRNPRGVRIHLRRSDKICKETRLSRLHRDARAARDPERLRPLNLFWREHEH